MDKKINKEEELLWVKLQGNWNDANYRYDVARKGRCLDILIHDKNRGVQAMASRKKIDVILKRITDN